MASSRQRVWLITGASSSLGYGMCLSVLARGEFVIAASASQQDLERLRSAGAATLRMDSEMSFRQITSRIRDALSFYGRIDYLVNNPEHEPTGSSSLYQVPDAYEANSFSYTAIQVTKAVAQESSVRQIVVTANDARSVYSSYSTYQSDTRNTVDATAQLFATEYRSRGIKVLLATPHYLSSGSRNRSDDTRAIAERIVRKVREGGATEPGLRIM